MDISAAPAKVRIILWFRDEGYYRNAPKTLSELTQSDRMLWYKLPFWNIGVWKTLYNIWERNSQLRGLLNVYSQTNIVIGVLLIKALHFTLNDVFVNMGLILVTIWNVTCKTREVMYISSHYKFMAKYWSYIIITQTKFQNWKSLITDTHNLKYTN